MIIKSKNLLLFNPDALKIEYQGGMDYKHYIVAYKNSKKFFVQGYDSEEKAREKLNILNEVLRKKETVLEI